MHRSITKRRSKFHFCQPLTQGFVLNNTLIAFLAVIMLGVVVYFSWVLFSGSDEKSTLPITQSPPGSAELKQAREQVNPKAVFTEVKDARDEVLVRPNDITPQDTPLTYLSSVAGECVLENCSNTIVGMVQSVNDRELTLLAQLEEGELLMEPKNLSLSLPESVIVKFFSLESFEYGDQGEIQKGDNIEIALNEQDEIVSATIVDSQYE